MNLIRVDSREPEYLFNLIRQSNPLIPITREELEAGDYWIESNGPTPLVIAERKTVADLLNSIKDGRLEAQIAECLDLTPHVALLIEGNMLISPFGTVETQSQHTGLTDMPKITNFRFDAAWGMLGLVQRMGAIVRFYQGDLYTNLVRVHHLMQKEVKEIDGRQIEIKQLPTPERILACFPGIGRKRAKLLIETFGSAAYAIWYLSTPLEEWDKDVPGIGQKTREKCLEALGGFSLMPFIETKGEPHESDNPPETN